MKPNKFAKMVKKKKKNSPTRCLPVSNQTPEQSHLTKLLIRESYRRFKQYPTLLSDNLDHA